MNALNPSDSSLPNRRRIAYILGGIVSGGLALSIHVFVLAALNIPTPQWQPRGVSAWINGLGSVIGTLLICRFTIASLRQRGWSVAKASFMPFVLFAMFSESLVRLPVMNGVVTASFAYPLIAGWTSLVPLLVTFLICAVLATRINDMRLLVVTGIAVWSWMKFVLATPLRLLVSTILFHAASLSRPEVYSPPYDWHVYVPAYVTYAEPVIGAFALVALMWDHLPSWPIYRCALSVLILLLAKGLVIAPLAYALAAPPDTRLMALLSMGQFSLEAAALVLLSIVTRSVVAHVR